MAGAGFTFVEVLTMCRRVVRTHRERTEYLEDP